MRQMPALEMNSFLPSPQRQAKSVTVQLAEEAPSWKQLRAQVGSCWTRLVRVVFVAAAVAANSDTARVPNCMVGWWCAFVASDRRLQCFSGSAVVEGESKMAIQGESSKEVRPDRYLYIWSSLAGWL